MKLHAAKCPGWCHYYFDVQSKHFIWSVEVGPWDNLELGIQSQWRYGCHGITLYLFFMDINVYWREWFNY